MPRIDRNCIESIQYTHTLHPPLPRGPSMPAYALIKLKGIGRTEEEEKAKSKSLFIHQKRRKEGGSQKRMYKKIRFIISIENCEKSERKNVIKQYICKQTACVFRPNPNGKLKSRKQISNLNNNNNRKICDCCESISMNETCFV